MANSVNFENAAHYLIDTGLENGETPDNCSNLITLTINASREKLPDNGSILNRELLVELRKKYVVHPVCRVIRQGQIRICLYSNAGINLIHEFSNSKYFDFGESCELDVTEDKDWNEYRNLLALNNK